MDSVGVRPEGSSTTLAPKEGDRVVHDTSSVAPVCAVFLRSNGVGEVLINEKATTVACSSLAEARRKSIEILSEAAKDYSSPLLVICSDPAGLFRLVVGNDGSVTEAPRDNVVTPIASAPSYVTPIPSALPTVPLIATTSFLVTDSEDDEAAPRHAFITESGEPLPAEQGWRGALARRGIPLPPSESELADRAHRLAVSQRWVSPRTICVVNGKGGAGKTPATICLASVFAKYGGAGVLAWDNNQTRGTLGWRTESGPHDATLLDLLPQIPYLMNSDSNSTALSQFVHHQGRDLYDVLRSKSVVLADEQRITPYDVDAIWKVAARFYRLILMDSGNDESDPMWRRMIDLSNQLVTVTTTRADHAEAGALLLEALGRRNEHSARLAKNSVTIISQADPKASDESIRRIKEGYADLSRSVTVIPYDPAMVEGTLSYDALKPATQRAWLVAAAEVAAGLGPGVYPA